MSIAPIFPFSGKPGLAPPAELEYLRPERGLSQVTLRSGRLAWFATRYADVRAILSDPRFSRAAVQHEKQVAREAESFALHTADGPVHLKRRRAVLRAFATKRASLLRPWLEELADGLLTSALSGRPPVDLVSEFTIPFALFTICHILGIPGVTREAGGGPLELFRGCVNVLMATRGPSAAEVHDAHLRLDDYFRGLLDEKRAALASGSPSHGLLDELLTETDEERRLTQEEILAHASGLMIAGHETTGHILATIIYVVLTRPDISERLRAFPAEIPSIAEEVLRWASLGVAGGAPVHVALEDVALPGGASVRTGELVIPALDAANWDPEVYEHPEQLDPSRREPAHLAFGSGPHGCPGAALARHELTVGVEAVLRRLPAGFVIENDLRWRTDMWIGGLWTLPIRW